MSKLRKRYINRGIVNFTVVYSIGRDATKIIHAIFMYLECGNPPREVCCNRKEIREYCTKLLNLQDFVFFQDFCPHLFKEFEQDKGAIFITGE
ncbi:hypothetical protein [Moraxella catarrhalis]|nr:hypothetical protein [Moraxella catarrhalis]MPX14472.1 hypothetical protein [Moraxella catarrhalis]